MRSSAEPSRVPQLSTWQVFRAPLLVGLVAAAGLAFGLFGDGVWDGLCWLGLSIPIVLSLIYGARRKVGLKSAPSSVQAEARDAPLRVIGPSRIEGKHP
ncbi:hypothetical protein ACQR16_33370 [Bradyrhizobium oligotrophicum]|uniref:hypothetical protein n=1 Tax=Bradyrhizobium oligotrophicum TaxID=44255 RepID=UPI003EBDEB96